MGAVQVIKAGRPGPRTPATSRAHPPADWMLHPVTLGALAVLVVNDHWLKGVAEYQSWLRPVTGKMSDVAGLVVFPLLLAVLVNGGLAVGGRALTRARRSARSTLLMPPTRRSSPSLDRSVVLGVAIVVTGVGFAAVQVVPAAGEAYAAGLGVVRWLPSMAMALITGNSSPPIGGVDHVMDATDLWCLPALVVSYVVGSGRLGQRQ